MTKNILTLATLSLFSLSGFAAGRASNISSYESSSSYSNARKALGFRYYGTFGYLHGSYWLDDQNAVGFGFGASQDFDNLGFLGDFRHNVYSRGAAALFAEGSLSFQKSKASKPFTILAGFGFDYALTDNLHTSLAYGLGLAFGSKVTDHFSTTQGPFHGNFGIEWRF